MSKQSKSAECTTTRSGSRREFLRRIGVGGALVATSGLWATLGQRVRGVAQRVRAEAPKQRIARIMAQYGPELGRRDG